MTMLKEIKDTCCGCGAVWRSLMSAHKKEKMFVCGICGEVESDREESVFFPKGLQEARQKRAIVTQNFTKWDR